MKKKKTPAINRTQAREMERKFTPAIKSLSAYMHNTTPTTSAAFVGYEVPAGSFTDSSGREWQVIAMAVCNKDRMIKKDEIRPIIKKWAIGLRARAFIKYLIDKAFS